MDMSIVCFAFLISFVSADEHWRLTESSVEWVTPSSWKEALTNRSLIDDIVSHLNQTTSETFHARLAGFDTMLQPMYVSTPKNRFDRLGHAAVRYTLNRLFVQKHGWFVNGLFELNGGNTSTVTKAILHYVPEHLQHAFETRISGLGLSKNETALLATTIESSIFEDAIQSFLKMCARYHVDLNNTEYPARMVDKLLQLHTGMRSVGKTDLDGEPPYMFLHRLPEVYKRWPQAVKMLVDLRKELEPGRQQFDLKTILRLLVEIEARFSRWMATNDCAVLSNELREIEEGRNTGCVRLSDFYAKSRTQSSGWLFIESPESLRKMGALDESDPANPRVLTANYVNSPGNCVRFSNFYLACCMSECEMLQIHIENAVRAPRALPEDIIATVKSQPTTPAIDLPALSVPLLQHLHEIADAHGGQVPLYSRLFAQWMHFAYPRTCSYPQLSGTMPQTGEATDLQYSLVAPDFVENYLEKSAPLEMTAKHSVSEESVGTCMAWSREDESFIPEVHSATTSMAALEEDLSVWSCVYTAATLAFVALMWALVLQRMRLRKKMRNAADAPMLV